MALHKNLYEEFNNAVFRMPKDITSVIETSEKLYLSSTQNNNHEGMALALCIHHSNNVQQIIKNSLE